MKALSLSAKLGACLVATLAIATFASAEEEKQFKLLLQTNPEAGLVKIETGELALGETRSFTSEKGRPVLLTRTEQGFEIDVDGKKTVVDLPPPGGDGFAWETRDEETAGEGGAQIERHVIVKRLGGDAALQVGGDGPHLEIHGAEKAAGGKKVIVLGGDGHFAAARAHLLASGALDGLDPAARDRILAALGGPGKDQK
jgi:hypothetical protein